MDTSVRPLKYDRYIASGGTMSIDKKATTDAMMSILS